MVTAEIEGHSFLISALVRGEWSASGPDRFTPGERANGTHWIGAAWAQVLFGTLPGVEPRCFSRRWRYRIWLVFRIYLFLFWPWIWIFCVIHIFIILSLFRRFSGHVYKPRHIIFSLSL